MNYEDLYQTLQAQEKSLKDTMSSLSKLQKAIGRETESGDIKSLSRDLKAMTEAAAAVSSILGELETAVNDFDTKAYFESGDFAEQMLAACGEREIDVQGNFPTYEMFPYKIRLDAENQDVYMDRKKVQCVRPKHLADTIKAGQEKLNKAHFNAQTFLGELAEAYDLAVLKLHKRPGVDLYLSSLYKFLAPMSRFRKDYDQQSFAYDLARLYNSGEEATKSGRRFQFGPSKNNSGKSFRILDNNGKEQFLSMICFYDKQED